MTLPTVGYQCYQPKTGRGEVVCNAKGSSVYQNNGYFGDYGAYLAVDGQLSPGNSGFYHSNLEPYPSLQIQFLKPDLSDYEPVDVNRVVIYMPCDSNELYRQTNFEVRWTADPAGDPIKHTPRLHGGKMCRTTTRRIFAGG